MIVHRRLFVAGAMFLGFAPLGCGIRVTHMEVGAKPSPAEASPLAAEEPTAENLVGKVLPAFHLTDLKGDTLTNENLKGTVLLIDFWATWCSPCRMVSPILQQLHQEFENQGLVVIGANVSETDDQGNPVRTRDRAEKYAAEHGYTFRSTYGADDFSEACHVEGLPTLMVVDRDGVVRNVFVGFDEGLKKQLESAIRPLLKK